MTSIDTQNSDLNDLVDPQQFIGKLSTLQQQLPSVLDDFKKYYVFYNKNPDYPEYSQMFENIKSNLNTINSSLFTLSNSVDVNTNNISVNLFALNKLIKKEKNINRKLKDKLGIIEHKLDSTDEMIDDYGEMYDERYLRNWALFLCILASGIAISVVFKN